MSDRPIQVGDLVVVVRCCCGMSAQWLGFVFRARDFVPVNGGRSSCCGTYGPPPYFTDNGNGGFSSAFLKRIPPLSELEGQRTEEKLREGNRLITLDEVFQHTGGEA